MAGSPKQNYSGPPGAGDFGLLMLLGAIWGMSFLFIKVAVETIPALPMTTLRLAFSVILMVGAMVWLGHRLPRFGPIWIAVFVSALFGNVLPFLLIAWGQEKVDAGLGAILMSPSPLMAAALAHFFTSDEKLNGWKLAGIGLGMVGVVVLMGLDKLGGLGGDGVRQLAIISAGAGYAINSVANRGLTGGSAVGNITAVMIVSFAMLAPVTLVLPDVWQFSPSVASMSALAAIVVFSTCLGTLLMLALVRRQGAAFTAQVNFLVPMFGVVWGTLFLAERPTIRSLIGLVLILAGVAVARQGSGLRPAAGRS
ncbi:MAG: DMT family transporter [Hyphomicrobiaceae bacterium]